MAELLLGIDVGTYSSKGVLVTPSGEVLRKAVVQHGVSFPHPGWAEQDADSVWWSDTALLCHHLLDGAPYAGSDVAAVGVSAIGPCLLPLDSRGRPLRPGILYGVDTRASIEIRILTERWGAESIFDFSRMHLTSQAIGPKILWLRRNEPTVWEQTAFLTTASSYLVQRLTGEHVIDHHTAAHYMPLYDPVALGWSERFSEGITDLDLLPRPGWSCDLAGGVTAKAASETGLVPGTPVTIGTVDALSEAVSVNVVQPGDLMIMYGSSTFFILVTDRPRPHPLTWTLPGAFEGQHTTAAGMATSGSITRWFRDELARDLPDETAYLELFREASEVGAGSSGLLVLPYFNGERTPINDPSARGAIIGLSLHHTRAHVFRAVLEGVAYGIRHNIETLSDGVGVAERIVAVGGGTTGDTWLQIVSDAIGREQEVPRTTLGASYGDAFLAGLAVGIVERGDLKDWADGSHVVRPTETARATYDAGYRQYRELYTATAGIMHELSRAGTTASKG
jgi:xylulokinase